MLGITALTNLTRVTAVWGAGGAVFRVPLKSALAMWVGRSDVTSRSRMQVPVRMTLHGV